ncbi:MAG TPA: spore germination protein GerW family protein [Bacillota bacterium]|nr:spore germination protein GerW family protein [Bacillota bacterium]
MGDTTTPFDVILDELGKVTQAKAVFGDPIQVDGLTLIPVVDISVGLGAGLGQAPGKNGEARIGGGGQGGGGGARISAKAVIAIKEGTATVLSLGRGVALEHLLEALPDLVQRVRPAAK